MSGMADRPNMALRQWLSQVLAGHGFEPGSAGCRCGWVPRPGTAAADQAPWLEHRTDVILDVLEFTGESRQAQEDEWQRLAELLRRRDQA